MKLNSFSKTDNINAYLSLQFSHSYFSCFYSCSSFFSQSFFCLNKTKLFYINAQKLCLTNILSSELEVHLESVTHLCACINWITFWEEALWCLGLEVRKKTNLIGSSICRAINR